MYDIIRAFDCIEGQIKGKTLAKPFKAHCRSCLHSIILDAVPQPPVIYPSFEQISRSHPGGTTSRGCQEDEAEEGGCSPGFRGRWGVFYCQTSFKILRSMHDEFLLNIFIGHQRRIVSHPSYFHLISAASWMWQSSTPRHTPPPSRPP